MSKLDKRLCIVGSLLLLAMGLFHGSGLNWVTSELAESSAKPFLKDVFPVLFIHVSIQLIGLASLGAAVAFFRGSFRIVAIYIAIMVGLNTALAFWLGAYPPGVLLACAAACFGIVGIRAKESSSS